MVDSAPHLMPIEPTPEQADQWLAEKAGLGDREAQLQLVDRLLNQVRRTASYLAGGEDDADDLAQAAMIRILGAAAEYRGDCSLEYWAERITVHTCAKRFDKFRRRRQLFSRTHVPAKAVTGMEEATDAHRARRRLAELLGTLDTKVRTAMVLHYLNGHRIPEVADITGAPINTVRGRLRTGRKKLRQKILNDPLLRVWVKEVIP